MSKLSKNLKKLRNELGITQEKMAEHLGILRPRYSAYEEYRAEPNISLLLKISIFYNITIDDLIKKEL